MPCSHPFVLYKPKLCNDTKRYFTFSSIKKVQTFAVFRLSFLFNLNSEKFHNKNASEHLAIIRKNPHLQICICISEVLKQFSRNFHGRYISFLHWLLKSNLTFCIFVFYFAIITICYNSLGMFNMRGFYHENKFQEWLIFSLFAIFYFGKIVYEIIYSKNGSDFSLYWKYLFSKHIVLYSFLLN